MKVLISLILGVVVGLGAALPAQAAYPDKPVRIIVPFPPGGGTDVLARLVGQKLEERWGVPVVVENRAGADTQIGTALVANAEPDGYTFGFVSPAFAINKSLYPKLPFDAIKDFTPVSLISSTPAYLVVNQASEVASLQELVSLAQRANGSLNYSSSSSTSFVYGELFRAAAGIEATHVGYRGSAPSVMAVASGEVAYTLDTLMATKPLIDSRKIKVLAVSTRERTTDMPGVPTLSESGLADFELVTWYGMLSPAGLPKEILETVNAAVRAVLETADVREKLAVVGSIPTPSTSEEFMQFLSNEFARFEGIVQANKLQPGR